MPDMKKDQAGSGLMPAGTPLNQGARGSAGNVVSTQLQHGMTSSDKIRAKSLPTLSDVMAGLTSKSGMVEKPAERRKPEQMARAKDVTKRQKRSTAVQRQAAEAAEREKEAAEAAAKKAPKSLEGRSMQIQDRVDKAKGKKKSSGPVADRELIIKKKPSDDREIGRAMNMQGGGSMGTDRLLKLQQKAAEKARRNQG